MLDDGDWKMRTNAWNMLQVYTMYAESIKVFMRIVQSLIREGTS